MNTLRPTFKNLEASEISCFWSTSLQKPFAKTSVQKVDTIFPCWCEFLTWLSFSLSMSSQWFYWIILNHPDKSPRNLTPHSFSSCPETWCGSSAVQKKEGGSPLECWIHFWAPQCRNVVDVSEYIQQRAREMMTGLQLSAYEKKLRELRLFHLEKGRLRGIIAQYV